MMLTNRRCSDAAIVWLGMMTMEPGPNFSLLIKRVRALQLDGEIATSEQAIRWATENVEGL